MGLIKAGIGAVGGVLADQWREYFYHDALGADVLISKGVKKTSGRSSNTKGSDNVITNGSVIAVADGQCMIIVEQGKVVDLCAEPGEYVFDQSTEPSIFYGGLGKGILDSFKMIGKRFTFGGETPKDQRVYYINTKEIVGNKYGTPSAIPFRVIDPRAGIDIDISISCFGEYSFHIINPILLYTNVTGNVDNDYRRDQLDSQLKTELLTALQPAFASISQTGIRYSQLPAHTDDLATLLNNELSSRWRELRGIEIVSFGMSSVRATEEDEAMLKHMQRSAAYTDANLAQAELVEATGEAMRTAAGNEGSMGAMGAFMGMNMAAMAGQGNMAAFAQINGGGDPRYAVGQNVAPGGVYGAGAASAVAQPAQPAQPAWTCPACAAQNNGRFCTNCGAARPAGAPQYRCAQCGWTPADPARPPRFCPECGNPFGAEDIL